ncbi:Uncharacterised protein [Mycolicibacterium phlei]|nr:hypothetical protein [Mycolicibacterium phlei]KXW76351.1 membrane protein [Mycolicibacterium phlei DSM 43071]STZ22190.1 Uncharacterised protein [Mycolicibacterium phlei]VEG11826.1 Uncharacterised protein [Mycobacteroides chelonae]
MEPSVTVLAHGLGGSTDLPIPYTYALIGAAWALTATFAVVALAWRKPRFDPANPVRPLQNWVTTCIDAPVVRWAAALAGLAFAVWVGIASVLAPPVANPLPGVFYVLLWVGLVTVSLLFGPVWRAVSPVRAVLRFLGGRSLGLAYPPALGYWPAALGLFAFVWLELASPDPGSLTVIQLWLVVYLVVTLAGALCFGPRWCARADPFEVYSVVASRLSPWRRDPATGRVAVGNPFDHLPSLPVRPGTVAVLAVLLGSTAFDSFSAMPGWRRFVYDTADSAPAAVLLNTAGLLAFTGIVAATFCLAAMATGGVDRTRRRALPGLMAHSLVPIVLGYVFAHYLTYLVERGQQTLILLFGLDAEPSYLLSMHPTLLATLKVGFVVAGHVGGVIAAHDRALRVLPAGHQLTGQLAMMLVMVGYTFTGLYLLFGG